jgi:ferric-dicitrate binding protein FerR (iron transport regulator)
MDTELNTSGMEEIEYLAALLLKQLRHEITVAELQYLENWKASHPSHALISEQVNNSEQLLSDLLAMKQVDLESRWHQITAQIDPVSKPVPLYRRWYTYAAAALVLLVAGAITWPYVIPKRSLPPIVENKEYTSADFSVPPGGNKAMLTLANGKVIELENAANGKLAQQGNAAIVKLKDGELKYEQVPGASSTEAIVNTLSTPRGGQYSVVLPDGSKVWLNAASSIKYPTNFSAKERRVVITGEAYFNVAKLPGEEGKRKPFIVDVQSPTGEGTVAEMEVMGTQFNIMAYNEERTIATTLVNGKVKVSANNNYKLLGAGQQAQISMGSDDIKVVRVEDLDDALAWKNGFISLNNSDIKYIMRTLSRWYNIEVKFPGKVPGFKFNGTISRSENISTVIKTLEYNGVHFKLQKNSISVLP